jgi:hypothetical protein
VKSSPFEYLAQLVQRGKEPRRKECAVGDVVLVGSDNTKRIDWPLGRIMELFPGRDGVKRVARVKTARGFLERPLQRLFPLEVSSTSELLPIAKEGSRESMEKPQSGDLPAVYTRSGRLVKKTTVSLGLAQEKGGRM